jgi:hypothetical protein
MLLNENTLKVINLLRDINEGFIISYPITGIKDSNTTISAFIDLEKLGNEPFSEFGIMKFKELFDLLSIAGKDADMSLNEGIITISSDTINCKYLTTNLLALEDFRAKTSMISFFDSAPKVVEFDLSNVDLDKIKKVSVLLNFEDLVLSTYDTFTELSVKNKQASSNSFTMKLNSNVEIPQISVLLGVNNVKKLPPSDYKVKVAKHPTMQDKFLVKFESENIPGLCLFLATKANQKE